MVPFGLNFYFWVLRLFCGWDYLPGQVEIVVVFRLRRFKNIMESFLANWKFESSSCVFVSSRFVQQRLLRAGDTIRCSALGPWQACAFPANRREKKGASLSVEVVKASEVEILFGAWKPIYSGMHRPPGKLLLLHLFIYLFIFCYSLFNLLLYSNK